LVRDPVPVRRTEVQLLKAIGGLVRDRVLVCFVVAVLMIFTGEGIINSLVVFAFSVGLQLPGKVFWVIFIVYVATLSALPITLRLSRHIEKHWLLAGGLSIKAMGYAAHLWVPLGNFPVVAALWVVVGVAHAATLVLPASILADVIDHGDVAAGERRSGAYVAIYNLAMKVGMALGVGLAFGLLAMLHYDPSAAHYSTGDARNIRWLAFTLPALLEASAIVLLLRNPITRMDQKALRQSINSRQIPSVATVN
jgi:Na+/melibiose symporter-like transporter